MRLAPARQLNVGPLSCLGSAMCPHCEKFRGGLGGAPESDYIDGLAANGAYFLVLCPLCGAPWLGHGFEPHIMRELTAEGVKEVFPDYTPSPPAG